VPLSILRSYDLRIASGTYLVRAFDNAMIILPQLPCRLHPAEWRIPMLHP
jgi:hypothetical protein